MINLGDKVKDRVTGFIGIAVSKYEWLNGCVRFGVQGPLKDGKPPELEHVDEYQLTAIKRNVIHPLTSVTGGPRPAPKRAKDDSR